MAIKIPAIWMRGGTSKGLFFNSNDLPQDPIRRDELLLAAIGSPDPYGKQIDGLGGATSSTSKVVLIKPSDKTEFDVDYTFGHVAIDRAIIDYSGNCGNLSSAVGVFAIEQDMVKVASSGTTCVRVWQTNLSQAMLIHVPTSENAKVLYNPDYEIAGVTKPGSMITVEFLQLGDQKGYVLPSKKTRQIVELENGEQFPVTLIKAGNATVFVAAESLGLNGHELPNEINSNTDLLSKVENIRCAAAVEMGLADTTDQARQQPAIPKVAFIAKAQDYYSTQNTLIKADRFDLSARIFSMGKLHHAFTGTGAIALAVASAIPGTLPADLLHSKQRSILNIGHSAGLMDISANVENINGEWIAQNAALYRTARSLMRGEILIPEHYLS